MFNFKRVNTADLPETVNGLKSQYSLFPWAPVRAVMETVGL